MRFGRRCSERGFRDANADARLRLRGGAGRGEQIERGGTRKSRRRAVSPAPRLALREELLRDQLHGAGQSPPEHQDKARKRREERGDGHEGIRADVHSGISSGSVSDLLLICLWRSLGAASSPRRSCRSRSDVARLAWLRLMQDVNSRGDAGHTPPPETGSRQNLGREVRPFCDEPAPSPVSIMEPFPDSPQTESFRRRPHREATLLHEGRGRQAPS